MAGLSLNNLSGLSSGYDPKNVLGGGLSFGTNPALNTDQNGQILGQGGSVLGAQAPAPAPAVRPTSVAPAAAPQPNLSDMFNSVAGKINQSYDVLNQNFDQQAGMLPDQRTNLEQQVNSLFGGNQNTLDIAKQGALDQLTGSAQQVESRQKQSMQTLDQRMRDLLQAADKRLGTLGVNGSGQDEVSMAMSKLLAQQGGQVQQQANDLMNQIELKKADVANTYQQELSKLKTNQSNQLLQIGQWYNTALADVQNRKATANASRYQDLANLEAQLKSQALSMASNVQNSAQAYQSALDQWAQQNASSLAGMQQKIGSALTIDPGQINGSFDPGSGTFSGTAFNGGLGIQAPVGEANSSWLLPSLRRDQQ